MLPVNAKNTSLLHLFATSSYSGKGVGRYSVRLYHRDAMVKRV